MKLHATIAESQIEIELHEQGSQVLAVVDGRKYDIDVRILRDDHYLLISNAQVFDCLVQGRPESGSTLDVIVGTDRAAADKLAQWLAYAPAHVTWCNAYGCTESTITSTTYEPGNGACELSPRRLIF